MYHDNDNNNEEEMSQTIQRKTTYNLELSDTRTEAFTLRENLQVQDVFTRRTWVIDRGIMQ